MPRRHVVEYLVQVHWERTFIAADSEPDRPARSAEKNLKDPLEQWTKFSAFEIREHGHGNAIAGKQGKNS